MEKYMRLYNDDGDYLELQPNLDFELKMPVIEYSQNLTGGVFSKFFFDEKDLFDIIIWSNEQLNNLKKEKAPSK